MLPKGTLGPGILGQDQFEKEKYQTEKGRNVYGPGITGEEPDAGPPLGTPGPFPDMSVSALRNELLANPAFLDGAIETEFKRDPEPRRGALKLFLEIEAQEAERRGFRRPEVETRLEEALGS